MNTNSVSVNMLTLAFSSKHTAQSLVVSVSYSRDFRFLMVKTQFCIITINTNSQFIRFNQILTNENVIDLLSGTLFKKYIFIPTVSVYTVCLYHCVK